MFSEPYMKEGFVDRYIGTRHHDSSFSLVVSFCGGLHLLQEKFLLLKVCLFYFCMWMTENKDCSLYA